jgi:hypothetical protein
MSHFFNYRRIKYIDDFSKKKNGKRLEANKIRGSTNQSKYGLPTTPLTVEEIQAFKANSALIDNMEKFQKNSEKVKIYFLPRFGK